jgi:Tfp pilus assembly protein PilF
MRYPLLAIFGWLICLQIGGCSFTQPQPAPIIELAIPQDQADIAGPAEQMLQAGLKQYDQGQYKRATASLQQAIDVGLTSKSRVIAHKHLAFIYCVSNRISLCRSEFNKAFELDPRFDLAPAEVGHPQWGPVFRSVKSGQRTAS